MTSQGFGRRIKQAILDLAAQRGGEVAYSQIGLEVAAEEGREKPYSAAAISEWIQERSEPKLRTFRALGLVLGKEPAWLMALDTVPEEPSAVAPTTKPRLRPIILPETPPATTKRRKAK